MMTEISPQVPQMRHQSGFLSGKLSRKLLNNNGLQNRAGMALALLSL
jgi:hypothetical protein